MYPIPTVPGPAQIFALILDGLCKAAAARMAKNPATRSLLMLLWVRLRRAMVRFASLAERAGAGRLPPPRKQTARRPARRRPGERLPRGSAWLFRLLPGEAACFGSQLGHLLAQPEMTALIAAAPQAGRILRPLCRTLGVPLPAVLARPPKPPPVRPPPVPPPFSAPDATQPDMAADPPGGQADPPRRPRRPISWRLLCGIAEE